MNVSLKTNFLYRGIALGLEEGTPSLGSDASMLGSDASMLGSDASVSGSDASVLGSDASMTDVGPSFPLKFNQKQEI